MLSAHAHNLAHIMSEKVVNRLLASLSSLTIDMLRHRRSAAARTGYVLYRALVTMYLIAFIYITAEK